MEYETLFTPAPGPTKIHVEDATEAKRGLPPALGDQPILAEDAASGLSEDKPVLVRRGYGRVGMIGDPEVLDERMLTEVIEDKPWYPSNPEETIKDYDVVRPIPGLSMKATNRRLAEMGLGRVVEGRHGDLMAPEDRIGPFKGFVRDVLISARGRYYYVGAGPCPFETGPNGEISRHEFEKVR